MKVYHAKKPTFGIGGHPEFNEANFDLVAEITRPGNLFDAFAMTQNGDDAWRYNSGLKPFMAACRSTSVGDVVEKDGVFHRCENTGWSIIFKWTDKHILEFCRMTTSEVYGVFKGKKSLEEKLEHYKTIKSKSK